MITCKLGNLPMNGFSLVWWMLLVLSIQPKLKVIINCGFCIINLIEQGVVLSSMGLPCLAFVERTKIRRTNCKQKKCAKTTFVIFVKQNCEVYTVSWWLEGEGMKGRQTTSHTLFCNCTLSQSSTANILTKTFYF